MPDMQRVWSTYYNEQGEEMHSMIHMEDKNSSYNRSRRSLELTPTISNPFTDSMSSPHIRLDPPVPPFSLPPSASLRSVTPPSSVKDNVSLTVNYLPTKFSLPHSPGIHKRKGKGAIDAADVPKRGGGREAFRTGEARMPGVGDEDYDGVIPREGGKTKPRLRWNKFKWMLFVSNTLLSVYSIVGLIFCLLTWFDVWKNADIIRVGNRPELILSTLAASMGVVTSLVGWSGILLNNRAFLAVYNLLLWVTFALLVVPGYVTYRRRAFNLEGKINSQWSRSLGTDGRLRIQNELECCGYFSPFTEATVSQTCYSRSTLPGCKGPYLKFERTALERWYIVVFGIVPFHIGILVTALLCANHVTYRFGKGMMPKAYRLSLNSMAVIMDNYANQLAEEYGSDVATEILARARTGMPVGFAGTSQINLGLDTPLQQTMPYISEPSFSSQHSPYGHVSEQGEHIYGEVDMNNPLQSPYETQYPRRI